MLNVGQEIIDVLLSCFGKPFVVLAIASLALIVVFWGNSILGATNAAFDPTRKFDWKLFVGSILKTLVVFIVVLTTGYILLLIPALLQYGEVITPEIEEILQGAISYGALLYVIIKGIYKNGADIIGKIKELLGIADEEPVAEDHYHLEDYDDSNCGIGGPR